MTSQASHRPQVANHKLHSPLLAWFDAHKRDLPWRENTDPYRVWVSEVMLQQTQVATALPYYQHWMQRFPSVEALAAADHQQVLAAWQGLGYYRRVRLLLNGARWVSEHGWPASSEEWKMVSGVGDYTAGALAAICLGEATPAVDGNVERVFARLAGCIDTGPGLRARAWEWARRVMHNERPGDWNQALMELGALVCKPRNPDCRACPLARQCVARLSGQVKDLPRKVASAKTVALQESAYVPLCDGRFGVVQIPTGEWWEGMWEFPTCRVGEESRLHPESMPAELSDAWPIRLGSIRHHVTHHRIHLEAHLLMTDNDLRGLRYCSAAEIGDLPMPSPQRRIARLASAYLGIT